jgi:hypothetical protein
MSGVETLARQAERYFVRRSELAEGNYRLEKLADGTTVPLVPSATLREAGVVEGELGPGGHSFKFRAGPKPARVAGPAYGPLTMPDPNPGKTPAKAHSTALTRVAV